MSLSPRNFAVWLLGGCSYKLFGADAVISVPCLNGELFPLWWYKHDIKPSLFAGAERFLQWPRVWIVPPVRLAEADTSSSRQQAGTQRKHIWVRVKKTPPVCVHPCVFVLLTSNNGREVLLGSLLAFEKWHEWTPLEAAAPLSLWEGRKAGCNIGGAKEDESCRL